MGPKIQEFRTRSSALGDCIDFFGVQKYSSTSYTSSNRLENVLCKQVWKHLKSYHDVIFQIIERINVLKLLSHSLPVVCC